MTLTNRRHPTGILVLLVLALVVSVAGAASATNGGGNITSGPPDFTNSNSATFTWGDPTSFCDLDGAGFVSQCTSPTTFTGLADGAHVFRTCGNHCGPGSTITEWHWVVDTHGPSTPSMAAPTAPFQTTAPLVEWAAATDGTGSGVAAYRVRYRRAAYSGSFGAFVQPSAWQALSTTGVTSAQARGYTYCYSVQAQDRAMNLSSWSSEKCTAQALDDRAPTRSRGWTLATGPAYYAKTLLVSRTRGATLSIGKAAVDRIGLLVTKCPTCGSISIKVGTTVIARPSLFGSTTATQQWIPLKPFSLRTAKVTITVTSSHRLVEIDGLGLSRR